MLEHHDERILKIGTWISAKSTGICNATLINVGEVIDDEARVHNMLDQAKEIDKFLGAHCAIGKALTYCVERNRKAHSVACSRVKVPPQLQGHHFRINCSCGWMWRETEPISPPKTQSAKDDTVWRSHRENMVALRLDLRDGEVRGLARPLVTTIPR